MSVKVFGVFGWGPALLQSFDFILRMNIRQETMFSVASVNKPALNSQMSSSDAQQVPRKSF